MNAIDSPNRLPMPQITYCRTSTDSLESRRTQTESNPRTSSKFREIDIQSPHMSIDSTNSTQHQQTLASSDLRTATSTLTSMEVTSRPPAYRRTSTITWQDTHETNMMAVTVPPILKKEVPSSKAGRMKPAVEKLASWFKGSPENLEEIEEALEDDRRWKRKVREWKEMKDEVESVRGSISEKGYGEKSRGGRGRRKFLCW